jgi:hypothetical protein
MSAEQTTTFENVKNRVRYLMEHELFYGEFAPVAQALCEEIDQLKKQIQQIRDLRSAN